MVPLVPNALPEPKDEPLARSPLKLVAFQLRHSQAPSTPELQVGLAAQERLGGAVVWRLEPIQTQTVTMQAGLGRQGGSPSVEVQQTGWRLNAEDGGATVTLATDSIGLEATVYPGWPIFSTAIDALLAVAEDVTKPRAELRLGLRYINRIEQPEVKSPGEWDKWIDSKVLGVIQHPMGSGLAAAQQQLDMRLGDGNRATVQHGFLRDAASGKLVYVIDLDAYREGARAFDSRETKTALDKLHQNVLAMFQSMITPSLYDYLRGDVGA
jgi:uncharacterized protein (TIGR04255 family)